MESVPAPHPDFFARLARLKAAIALEKPDRTPVMSQSDTFCANHLGASMSRFSTDPVYSAEVMTRSFAAFPGFDAAEFANCVPDFVGAILMSRMLVAGRELPEGRPFMVDEEERLSVDDYERIVAMGWRPFFASYCKEKLGLDLSEYMPKLMAGAAAGARLAMAQGLPVFTLAVNGAIPLEPLSGGRSMGKFVRDLFKIPDRVQAAMDVMLPEMIAEVREVLAFLPVKPLTVFVGIGRGSSGFLSPRFWERFVWPYLKAVIDAIHTEGIVANLHFEGDWERDLSLFREFPKGSCVFACEHTTDIFKIRDVLGDRMCIKGDVPSPMLAFSAPDEVYAYSRKLIEEMGDGFILAPACTMPPNAKIENVEAMLAAVKG